MADGLSIEDLTVLVRGGAQAVTDVSLRLAPGRALGLIGESGSGKSLTARAALGLLPHGTEARGRIRLDGRALPFGARRPAPGIAMVFQDPMSSLNPVLRVGDAIAGVVRAHEGMGRGAATTRAVALMRAVGIRDAAQRASAYPHEFSGGMRQRVMIAMALAARPRILLADEPTTALDVVVQAGILDLLDGLRRDRGLALLLVSHHLSVVAGRCERVAVMYAGEIVEEGSTAAVLAAPRMPYTAGLLASSRRRPGQRRLGFVAGAPPPLGEWGPGCRFAPRCPIVVDACRTGPIALREVGPDHRARCLRTVEAAILGPEDFGAMPAAAEANP